jgi:hypothetical protein
MAYSGYNKDIDNDEEEPPSPEGVFNVSSCDEDGNSDSDGDVDFDGLKSSSQEEVAAVMPKLSQAAKKRQVS